MKTATKNLALVIDGDNAPPKYTKHIIQFCEVFGTLSIKNAYGDWQQLPLSTKSNKIMAELGVKRVQQDRDGKNATDKKLQAEVRSMLDKGKVDIYFLVSNDGDFKAVCQEIIQKGAKVIGIGSKNTASTDLRKVCTLFFDVEEIIQNQSKPSIKSPAVPEPKTTEASTKKQSTPSTKSSPAPKAKIKTIAESVKNPGKAPAKSPVDPNTKKILKMLVKAYQNATQKDGWVHLSQLQEQFSQLEEQSNLKFAKKTISKWLKEFPDQFEVEGDYAQMKE